MKKAIIVADDKENIVKSMKKMLEPYYDVSTATSGLNVLELCDAKQYDALIIDVIFEGGMSGLETAAMLRENDKDIKIIIISAVDYSSATRQQAIKIGASFLEKPLQLERIRKILEGLDE